MLLCMCGVSRLLLLVVLMNTCFSKCGIAIVGVLWCVVCSTGAVFVVFGYLYAVVPTRFRVTHYAFSDR